MPCLLHMRVCVTDGVMPISFFKSPYFLQGVLIAFITWKTIPITGESIIFIVASKILFHYQLPLIAPRRSMEMIIITADISLHRALQGKKILTFTGHLLLIIALSESERSLPTFSIRSMRIRALNMTCKC